MVNYFRETKAGIKKALTKALTYGNIFKRCGKFVKGESLEHDQGTQCEESKQMVVSSSDYSVHCNTMAAVLFVYATEIGGYALFLLVSVSMGHSQLSGHGYRLLCH
jgi:hypothetical protein